MMFLLNVSRVVQTADTTPECQEVQRTRLDLIEDIEVSLISHLKSQGGRKH